MSEKFNLAAETAALFGYEKSPEPTPAMELGKIASSLSSDSAARSIIERAVKHLNAGNRYGAEANIKLALNELMRSDEPVAYTKLREFSQKLPEKQNNAAPFDLAKEQHKLWFPEEQ